MCYTKGCRKGGTYAIVDRRYCGRHFCEAIEKRVRKDVRIKKKITTKKSYTLLDSKTKEAAIAKRLLASIFQGYLKMKLVNKPGENTIAPTNMDREIGRMLPFYLERRRQKKPQGILFLDNVTDDEMLALAKIWDMPAKKEARNPIVEAIEEKHPGMRFALKKSLDEATRHG